MSGEKVVSVEGASVRIEGGRLICRACGYLWVEAWGAGSLAPGDHACVACGARRSALLSEDEAMLATAIYAGVERRVKAALDRYGL